MKLSKYIDHTLLKANASKEQIKNLCEETIKYDFKSVCINPCFITYAKEILKESDVLICTVIGFPLGAMTTESKVFEAKDAVSKGADEVDMVINISKLLDKDYDYCTQEIKKIKEAVGNKTLKVIIETCLLNDDDKVAACNCVVNAGADFVKTSTGFSLSGANLHDVELMKSAVNGKCLVKAAGGVKTKEDFENMINAGADRIGTSNGTKLL